MPGILWRVIVAVLAVLLAYALLPPVARLIGLSLSGDVLMVLRLCIAGIAAFYILRGRA